MDHTPYGRTQARKREVLYVQENNLEEEPNKIKMII